jgi:ribosomal protein L24
MTGKVIEINKKNNRVIVDIGKGDFIVFENIGDADIKIGDIVTGNLENHEGEIIKNISKPDKRIFVTIVGSHCTKLNAQDLLDLESDY